jgi:hypothetical protein
MSHVLTSAPPDQYRAIHEVSGAIGASIVVGTYGLNPSSANTPFGAGGSPGALAFYYDPTIYSTTIKMRLVVNGIVNATAPGASCTFQPGLFPATPAGGAANLCSLTAGSVISGSNPSAQGPLSATTAYTWDSTDFTPPSAGLHAVGIVLAGATTAASSLVALHARLLIRSL